MCATAWLSVACYCGLRRHTRPRARSFQRRVNPNPFIGIGDLAA
jgi:hypothetical protein